MKTLERIAPTVLWAIVVASIFLLPVAAFADTGDSSKSLRSIGSESGLEIRIQGNGKTLVRGAEVTAVSGTTITAKTLFGGSSGLSWTVKTNSETDFITRAGADATLSSITVGDIISFSGAIDTTTSALTVNADVVKDWAVPPKGKATMLGVASGVQTNGTFTLTNEKGVFVTVTTASTTVVMKGSGAVATTTVANGNTVRVTGTYTLSTKTLAAERIVIVERKDRESSDDRKGQHAFRLWIQKLGMGR